MKVLKTGVCVSCVVLAISGWRALAEETAADLYVGNWERASVSPGEGETLRAGSIMFAPLAESFDLAGVGKYVLPLKNVLSHDNSFALGVRAGQLDIVAEGEIPLVTGAPEVVTNKAALWLDAEDAYTRGMLVQKPGEETYAGEGKYNVWRWPDVREPLPLPADNKYTYWSGRCYSNCYASASKTAEQYWADKAGVSGTYWKRGKTYRLPCYEVKNGHGAIYHRTYQSGSWTGFVPPGKDDVVKSATGLMTPVYHIYVVASLSPSGYLLGTHTDPLYFSLVNKSGTFILAQDVNSQPAAYSSRVYCDGKAYNPHNAGVGFIPQNQITVLEVEMCGDPGKFAAFFNERDYAEYIDGTGCRQGGGWVHEAIWFTNRLSEVERFQVGEYLVQKWKGASNPSRYEIGLNDASVGVSEEALTDGRLNFAGSGMIVKNDASQGGRWGNLHAATNVPDAFAVRLSADNPDASVEFEDVAFPYRFLAGEKLTAAATKIGSKWTHANGAVAADTIAADGPGAIRLNELPRGVSNVTFTGGTSLTLAERPVVDSDLVPGTNTAASVAEADFDLGVKATKTVAVTVPVTGDYELEFREELTSTAEGVGGRVDLALMQGDETVWAGRTTAYHGALGPAGGAQLRRLLVKNLPAGDYTLTFKGLTNNRTERFRGVALKLATRRSADVVFPVPNGDFELNLIDFSGGSRAKSCCTNNTADGWTFEQSSTAAATTPCSVGIVTPFTGLNNQTYTIACTPYSRYGDTQLGLYSTNGCALSPAFTLPRGTWKFRCNIAMTSSGTGNWHSGDLPAVGTVQGNKDRLNSPNPQVVAKLVSADGETDVQSLGTWTTVSRRSMDLDTFPTAYVSDGTTPVRLRLCQTTERSAALIDNLEFVQTDAVGAGEPYGPELVDDGSFATCIPWTFQREEIDGVLRVSGQANLNDTDWGVPRCDDSSALRLCNLGVATQNVTFDEGLHRLSFWACRRTSFPGGVRAWIAKGERTNEIFRTESPLVGTNFLRRTALFRVPTSGTWTFGLQQSDGKTGGQATDVIVDCVSIRKVLRPGTAPTLPTDLSLSLGVGSRLNLDFVGTNVVREVRVNGLRRYGIISADRFPGEITGCGALYVEPRGLTILIK